MKKINKNIIDREGGMNVRKRRHRIVSSTYPSFVTFAKYNATTKDCFRIPLPGFGFEIELVHSADVTCYYDMLLRRELNKIEVIFYRPV